MVATCFLIMGAIVQSAIFAVPMFLSGIIGVILLLRAFTTRNCPACKSNVPSGATLCRHCQSALV
ncbi:hypothetical protein GCM10027601_20370 [Nocardioides ungokensis]